MQRALVIALCVVALVVAAICAKTFWERDRCAHLFKLKLHLLSGPEAQSMADVFSDDELVVLRKHARHIASVVMAELESGNHAAAWAASFLELREAVPLLRRNLLADRYFYGWEGSDNTTEAHFLMDTQYPHHLAYMRAIEALTGKPVARAVALTAHETQSLRNEAAKVDSSSQAIDKTKHFCAKWLLLKLSGDG